VILLVDTHLLLWAAGEPQKLPKAAKTLLNDADAQLWFSAASIWEVAIKRALGRSDFEADPRRLRRSLLDNAWRELVLSSEHAVAAGELPPIHKDPFDRILIAQAQMEGVTLMTSDDQVAQYAASIKKV